MPVPSPAYCGVSEPEFQRGMSPDRFRHVSSPPAAHGSAPKEDVARAMPDRGLYQVLPKDVCENCEF